MDGACAILVRRQGSDEDMASSFFVATLLPRRWRSLAATLLLAVLKILLLFGGCQ